MFIMKHPLTSLLVCAITSLGSMEGTSMTISAQGNVTSSLSTYSLNLPDINFNGKPYDQSLTFLQNANSKGTNYSYKKEVDGVWEPLPSAPIDAGHYQIVATTTTTSGTPSLADFEVPKTITLSPEGKKSEKISATSIPAGLDVNGLYFSFVPGQTIKHNPLADDQTGQTLNDIALALDFNNTALQSWLPKDFSKEGADEAEQAKIDLLNQSALLTLNPSTGELSLTEKSEEALDLVGEFYACVLACKNINGNMLAKYIQVHVKSQKSTPAYIAQSIQEGGEIVWTGLDHTTVCSSHQKAALQLQANTPEESHGNWYCNNQMIVSNEMQAVESLDPQVESSQSFVSCALEKPESSETLNISVNQGNPSPMGSYNFLYKYKTAEGSPKTLLYVLDVGDPLTGIATSSLDQSYDPEIEPELNLYANRQGEQESCRFQLEIPSHLRSKYQLDSVQWQDPSIEEDCFITVEAESGTMTITPPAISQTQSYPVQINYKYKGTERYETQNFTLILSPALETLGLGIDQLALYGGKSTELKLEGLPEETNFDYTIGYELAYADEYEDVPQEPKSLLQGRAEGNVIHFEPRDLSFESSPIKLKMTINYYGPTDISNCFLASEPSETTALSETIDVLYYTYPKSIVLPAAFHLGVGQSVNLNEFMSTKEDKSLSAAPITLLKAEKEGIIQIEGNRITALKAGETWLEASWCYDSQGPDFKPFLTAGMEISQGKSAHANGILIHVSANSSTITESDDFYIRPLKPFGTIGEAGLGMGNFTTSHTYGIMNDVVASVAAWKKADLYVGGRYIKESECTRQLGDLIVNADRGAFYPGKLSFSGNYRGNFYVPSIQKWNNPYEDVKKQADSFAWNSYIPAASIAGLMKGVEDDRFEPARTITRGEWILAMYRMAGEPKVSLETEPFADVDKESFYYTASRWAREHEISYGDGTNEAGQTVFNGQAPVQRQQAVSFLFRLGLDQGWITEEEVEEVAQQYKDGININPGNMDGVNWALDNLVITGKGEGETKTLDPTGGMLRGDATKPLVEGYLILNDPVKTGGKS